MGSFCRTGNTRSDSARAQKRSSMHDGQQGCTLATETASRIFDFGSAQVATNGNRGSRFEGRQPPFHLQLDSIPAAALLGDHSPLAR